MKRLLATLFAVGLSLHVATAGLFTGPAGTNFNTSGDTSISSSAGGVVIGTNFNGTVFLHSSAPGQENQDFLLPSPSGKDLEGLYLNYSLNLSNWFNITPDGSLLYTNYPGVHDPNIFYNSVDGIFYITYTFMGVGLAYEQTNRIGIIRSYDLINWSPVGSGSIQVSPVANVSPPFAPRIITINGTNYIYYSVIDSSVRTIDCLPVLDNTFTNFGTSFTIVTNEVTPGNNVNDVFMFTTNTSTLLLFVDDESSQVHSFYTNDTTLFASRPMFHLCVSNVTPATECFEVISPSSGVWYGYGNKLTTANGFGFYISTNFPYFTNSANQVQCTEYPKSSFPQGRILALSGSAGWKVMAAVQMAARRSVDVTNVTVRGTATVGSMFVSNNIVPRQNLTINASGTTVLLDLAQANSFLINITNVATQFLYPTNMRVGQEFTVFIQNSENGAAGVTFETNWINYWSFNTNPYVLNTFDCVSDGRRVIVKTATPVSTTQIPDFSQAMGAWSVRKLSTYSQYAMKVMRSSDFHVQDIGFSGSNLDTNSIKTFVGANTGYVVVWYDQSGHGHDLVNYDPSVAPLIVQSGVVAMGQGSHATLQFTNRGTGGCWIATRIGDPFYFADTFSANAIVARPWTSVIYSELFATENYGAGTGDAVILTAGGADQDWFAGAVTVSGGGGYTITPRVYGSNIVGVANGTYVGIQATLGPNLQSAVWFNNTNTTRTVVAGRVSEGAKFRPAIDNPVMYVGRAALDAGGGNIALDGALEELVIWPQYDPQTLAKIRDEANEYWATYAGSTTAANTTVGLTVVSNLTTLANGPAGSINWGFVGYGNGITNIVGGNVFAALVLNNTLTVTGLVTAASAISLRTNLYPGNPAVGGMATLWCSNGTLYLLTTDPFSATIAHTNKLGP